MVVLLAALGICVALVVVLFYQSGSSPHAGGGPAVGFNYLQPFPVSWGSGWDPGAVQSNLDRVAQLGGSLVRVFFVNDSYYFADGVCQSSYLDHLSSFLGWAGERGIRTVVNVGISVNAPNVTLSENSFSCFASRFSGDKDVYLWELTNEPDQSTHWNAAFWAKLQAVYGSLKAQDPSHQVAVAIGYASNMAWLCQNVFVPDVPEYHEYSPWSGPAGNATFIDKVRGDIDTAYQACGHRPVLIGETGFPSGPVACGLAAGCTEAAQEGYLGLVLQAVRGSCNEVAGVMVWTLTDFPQEPGTQGHYGVFAVVNGTYTQKPAAAVVESYSASLRNCG